MKPILNKRTLTLLALMLFSLALCLPRAASAAPPQPDLVVLDATPFKSGGIWYVRAYVYNRGTAGSPSCYLSMTIPPAPTQFAVIPPLAPGASAWVVFRLGGSYPAGRTAHFCADYFNTVPEWSETNNEYSYTF